jgi:glyoxylate carboligase
MKASDLMVKCLEREGVEYVFGVPGEENADFMLSLEDSEQHPLHPHAPRAGRGVHGRGLRPPHGQPVLAA